MGTFAAVACHLTTLPKSKLYFLRLRVDSFLNEIGLKTINRSLDRSSVDPAGMIDELAEITVSRSEELAKSIKIGAMAVMRVVHAPLLSSEQEQTLFEKWSPGLEEYGVSREIHERWIRGLSTTEETLNLDTVLSSVSELLAYLLEPLDMEKDTCFIAMPFREPFLSRYDDLYRPSLERAGFRAVRAWGGLSSEEYAMTMLTLISRCGALLADITGNNHNVVHEVGVAHGMVKPSFILIREDGRDIPTNLDHIPVMTYPKDNQAITAAVHERLGKFISLLWDDYVRRLRQYASDKHVGLEEVWPGKHKLSRLTRRAPNSNTTSRKPGRERHG